MLDATAAYLRQGGWVMGPLVLVSLVMWTLILERWRVLRRYARGDLDIPGLLAIARGEQPPPAPARRGLRTALVRTFCELRSGRPRLDREILAQCRERLDRELEHRHEAIAVLAAIAPLLGLLGTVVGMIRVFAAVSQTGLGNPELLSSGISEAMVTTAAGLIVGIPSLVAYNWLEGRAHSIIFDIEVHATRLLDMLRKRRQRTAVEAG